MRAVLRRFQVFALFPLHAAVQNDVDHTQNAVHRCAQFMRHVRQKLALGLAGGHGPLHRFLQRLGPLADAYFEKFLMLADLLPRVRQALDHLVEAVAEIFDFVARLADADGFQAAFTHPLDAIAQQFQRPDQLAKRESGDAAPDDNHDEAEEDTLADVECVLLQIVGQNDRDYPQHQRSRKHRELRGK